MSTGNTLPPQPEIRRRDADGVRAWEDALNLIAAGLVRRSKEAVWSLDRALFERPRVFDHDTDILEWLPPRICHPATDPGTRNETDVDFGAVLPLGLYWDDVRFLCHLLIQPRPY